MSSPTLHFTDLPLIEVALKRVPRTHIPISLPFVIQLRESLSPRFDRVLDLDALEAPPGGVAPAVYEAPLTCGCKFVDSSLGIAVSLQPDMLVVRWMESEGKPYPRYPKLKEAADDVVAGIQKIGLGPFETGLVNLAYANRVDALVAQGLVQPNPWPLADAWTPEALRSQGTAFETQSVFRGNDEIDRRVLVQTRVDGPQAAPWYLLLTVAGKKLSNAEALESAEDEVHQALIKWFPMLLSEDAKSRF